MEGLSWSGLATSVKPIQPYFCACCGFAGRGSFSRSQRPQLHPRFGVAGSSRKLRGIARLKGAIGKLQVSSNRWRNLREQRRRHVILESMPSYPILLPFQGRRAVKRRVATRANERDNPR